MAFVHLLCYLNRPCPSTTHRCGNFFINTAIMQLAAYEIDSTIEQPSFDQKVGQCASREVRRHDGLSAPKRRNEIVVNVNRQLFSSYAHVYHFKIQHRFRNPPFSLRYSRHKAFVKSQFKGGAPLRTTKM